MDAQTSMMRFYKAVADHDEDGDLDYGWLLSQIEDEDHPLYGPPIPWSMRPVIERVLHDIYLPALREQMARPSLLSRLP